MSAKVTIDIYEKFNLMDIMRKCPYAKEVLSGENIEQAIDDLKKVFCCCQSVPQVYMIKSFDAIDEIPKVSYTSEMIAKQILKKVIIGKLFRDDKMKPYSLWDLFIDNQLQFTVKAIKFFSDDEQVFSYFRGSDYKELDEVKEELVKPFLNHVHDVIANKMKMYINIFWFGLHQFFKNQISKPKRQ